MSREISQTDKARRVRARRYGEPGQHYIDGKEIETVCKGEVLTIVPNGKNGTIHSIAPMTLPRVRFVDGPPD